MSNEDFIISHDDGCLVHPRCLTCPLPECIFEKTEKVDRNKEIIEKYNSGINAHILSEEYNISERSIQKIVKNGKISD